MPSDPAAVPPPEWARKLADTCTGMTYDFIARLLASVREGAIRQARDTVAKMPCEFDDGDNVVVMRDAAVNAVDALLHTPPSGGAG